MFLESFQLLFFFHAAPRSSLQCYPPDHQFWKNLKWFEWDTEKCYNGYLYMCKDGECFSTLWNEASTMTEEFDKPYPWLNAKKEDPSTIPMYHTCSTGQRPVSTQDATFTLFALLIRSHHSLYSFVLQALLARLACPIPSCGTIECIFLNVCVHAINAINGNNPVLLFSLKTHPRTCFTDQDCLDHLIDLDRQHPGDLPCRAYGTGMSQFCRYGIYFECKGSYGFSMCYADKRNTQIEPYRDNRPVELSDGNTTRIVPCREHADCDLAKLDRGSIRSPKLEGNSHLWGKDKLSYTRLKRTHILQKVEVVLALFPVIVLSF